jgi:phospholipid/cholesterol/gamma-HCH transport system substrate-binding protein
MGIVVIAIVIVGVYISYDALNGLPLQSTYHVTVALHDADRLIPTDDVRVGGVRVGQVSSVNAESPHDGQASYALIGLRLSPSLGHLPLDTKVTVQAASALGATYVQLQLGHGPETLAAGGTLPLSNAGAPTVSVTDLSEIFNGSAARNFRTAVGDLGAGVAGRGEAINSTIDSIAALLPPATRVASTLAARAAGLQQFLAAFASTGTTLAARSPQLAGVVSNGATTFGAIAAQKADVGSMLEAAPPAEAAATVALQHVEPALDDLAALIVRLEPPSILLPRTLTILNAAITAGISPLQRLPTLTRPLRTTLAALESVSRLKSTTGAVRKLGDVMVSLDGVLSALTPAQVHCNVIGLFGQNEATFWGTLGAGEGPAVINAAIGTVGATGEQLQSAKPAASLHTDLLPVENATECDSDNEPYNPNVQELAPPTGPIPDTTRPTYPPPGVLQLARSVGLLAPTPPQR